jgi:hypothetical protein
MTPKDEVDKLIEKLKSGELEEVPDEFYFEGTVTHPPGSEAELERIRKEGEC